MRRSAEDIILTTSATRAGVEACADLVDAVAERAGAFYLPIPREVCEGAEADLGALGWILEPLLYLMHERRRPWRCYGDLEELGRRAYAVAQLAGLAVKAKVFGRIDVDEWGAVMPLGRPEPPKPSLAFGYVGRDAVVCGAPVPNPLELAYWSWADLAVEYKLDLIKYIVRYMDLVVSSVDLDEAYFKLVEDEEYRKFASAVVHRVGN